MRLIVIILLALISINLKSQDSLPEYKGIIKFYPLNLIGGHINAAYEKSLTQRSSLEFNGSYYFFDFINQYTEDQTVPYPHFGKGFALRLSYRYFLKRTAPTGTYLSPQIMYKFFYTDSLKRSYQSKDSYVNVFKNVYAFKLLLGKQYNIGKIFLDGYIGGGVRDKHVIFDEFYLERNYRDGNGWVVSEPRGKNRNYFHPRIIWTFHMGISIGFGIKK